MTDESVTRVPSQASLFEAPTVDDTVRPTPPLPGPRGAWFSPCRRFRYLLWRVWSAALPIDVYLMQNPSKAGARDPDMTVTKCCEFSRRAGRGGIVVVNPCALVETDSDAFERLALAGEDVVGPENTEALRLAFSLGGRIVVASGAGRTVLGRLTGALALAPEGLEVVCLGRTADGAPRHPSRLAYATPFEPYALTVADNAVLPTGAVQSRAER